MNNNQTPTPYVMLFVPWLLSLLFMDYPFISYLLAWLGSFLIFYISLSGKIKALPSDLPFAAQLMRPLILVQLIFAGYMSCTSIFYFIELVHTLPDTSVTNGTSTLHLTAQCQRHYSLAHAAFVTGILLFLPPTPIHKYSYITPQPGKLIFSISIIGICLSYLLSKLEGLEQLSHQFNTLSAIAGTLALTYAITERKIIHISCCLLIYGMNFYHALISGFKEPIILSIVVLAIFLYPSYKRTVIFVFLPLLFSLFFLLPTYNRIFREQAWSGGLSVTQAGQLALSATFDEENTDNNLAFFTNRLSEISMFTKYVQSTPNNVDHYGFDLVHQSLQSIIPRVFWPSKPNTEQLVMERVYKAGVINEASKVSAKPAFVVDAYLSGGIPGIFICLFSYGAMCQLISNKAEELFGGYTLGIALIFTGLFQIFWRGQSFEFLINSVFWSYISMYLIFWTLRFFAVVIPSAVVMPAKAGPS
ncbi:exosortase Y-associated Wzy-like protein [Pedobacter nyackensis]|uniref:exosortase Y-associated Wzy-like protein n=1 Tax=Pedobacter nyackensis TaxID=475255 RepID=UPI00292ECD2C|nr:hypothetical protein [Pedobacter nyackensis]